MNTHNTSLFYENLPTQEAFEMMRRFEFHYTPKQSSWLNMAELELSALSRQCLGGRRTPEIEILSQELEILVKARNNLKVKVNWQFTVDKAED